MLKFRKSVLILYSGLYSDGSSITTRVCGATPAELILNSGYQKNVPAEWNDVKKSNNVTFKRVTRNTVVKSVNSQMKEAERQNNRCPVMLSDQSLYIVIHVD